jgi:DNA-binding NarL/FixJ family response regulator
MDVRMPGLNGHDATRQIKAQHPEVHVLGMSVHHEASVVDDLLAAGASGYLLKGEASGELATAIRTVLTGVAYFCPPRVCRDGA